ncbi:MAG: AI-2E family transporter, partial [Nitrospirota bacterium]|nr:AI-2E family transporter [Nitrospirota bacterium]
DIEVVGVLFKSLDLKGADRVGDSPGPVGGIENVIKPIFIGRTSEMPFILILLGVLGGLEAFGVIGLFVGPVILAILQKLWQENTSSRT